MPSNDKPRPPVHGLLSFVVELLHDDDGVRLQQQLNTLVQTRPALRIEANVLERDLIVKGDDELDLMEVRREIASQYEGRITELAISYKETIRRSAEAEGKYIRQTGGSGNYGHCKLCVEPNEPGRGYEFANDIKDGSMPKEYIRAIDQGVQGALELGILAGYPIVDVKVTLYDGSYHDVDSNEMAFKFAGSIAFKEAARKASPVLLEPVMAVEVTVPEEFMGTIIGDINSRRGRIEGMEHAAGSQVIKAIVPLAEMLSSGKHGRPEYSMHFAGFRPVSRPDDKPDGEAGAYVKAPLDPKPGTGSAAVEREG